jgi:hypothetical protein
MSFVRDQRVAGEVGLFADTLPTLTQRSVDLSPPTQREGALRIMRGQVCDG